MSFLYSVEKSLEKRVAIHAYIAKFKYIPKSFTLYGSNNHMCWFILDEVFDFSGIIQNSIYTLNCTINNNSYFRFYKLQAQMAISKDDQTMEITFDESDFDDSPFYKIKDSTFSIQQDLSISPDYSKTIGLLEALIINNFHIFITTHRSEEENLNDHLIQNYSIFSNYIHPKEDLQTFDPRPKCKHEFIFHSFFLRVDSIFFKNKDTEITFYIEYLNSNDKWSNLIHTKTSNSFKSLNGKEIYGIRFDTTIFGFKDFDFFGTIQFSEKVEIIPSSYSAFPFWGSNLNGILSGIKQFTLTDPTSSGLFEAVGQYDVNDDSQKSFLREIHTIFEDFNEETSSITFRFGFKVRLSNYLMQVPERTPQERNRNPHKWKLEGSNDEINWVLLSEVEDNIFSTDVEGVVYNTTNTSDYFSSFRIVKFDFCYGNDSVRFNQLVLFRVEFFGIICPFYSEPSFFWELPITRNFEEDNPYSRFNKNSNVQPIIPIDLCNGIVGCLKYYGYIHHTIGNFIEFIDFNVNLVAIALINPPEDLKIIFSMSSNNYSLSLIHFNETNPIRINENIWFIKFLNVKYRVNKVSFSPKVDGFELFGFVSNNIDDELAVIKPGNSFEFDFPLTFQFDILNSVIASEFPNYNFNSEIETSFVKIKATKPMIVQNLPCQVIESSSEKYVLFDFIDSRLSLNFFSICTEKLESLNLKGSNDGGKTYEHILDFKLIHRNHDLKTFLIKSKNQKPYQLFKLEKSKSYKEIKSVKLYGILELIGHRIRKPPKLKALENTLISPGLDCQNGILNALKNFPLEKVKMKDVFTIDFIEISIVVNYISLFSFNESSPTKYLKIEGCNYKNEWCILFDKYNTNLKGESFFTSRNNNPISVMRITTDNKNFDFDKIEIFGKIIVSRPNPIPKKPPNFEFMLNPFNGILNSGLFEYKQTSHFHYVSIEFKNDVQLFVNKTFIEFNDPLKTDFFIEASNDSLHWTNLDFDVNKASLKKFEINIHKESGFRIFHFFSKSNFSIKNLELFGRVQKLNSTEKSDTQKETIELSSEKLTTFSYDNDHPFSGIFNAISHFFGSLSIPFSLKGTKGNEEDAISLFDSFSSDVVSFTSTSGNFLCVNFRLAKVKLSKYLIFFGPDLLPNSNTLNWKLEASNDMKNWIEIDSRSISDQKEIESFNIKCKKSDFGFFYNFRFLFKNTVVLRKIEFFGDYNSNSQDENYAIVKNRPVILRKNCFSGILASMCRITNAFDKGLVIASPPSLANLFGNEKIEPVTIDSIAMFDFIDSDLILSHYSIETTMKSWKVEVSSSGDKWIEIHSQTNFHSCNTFKILNCPHFSKIRIVNNDKKPQKLNRIEFFGTISDEKPSKEFKFDIMNGLLSLMAPHPGSVFNNEMTAKSSDYKFTNPIQIFDRFHINRIFCFTPSMSKNECDSPMAFVILEFWRKAIKVDNFAFILLPNSKIKNLKIEGKNSMDSDSKWVEIRSLNEDEMTGNNFIFRNSKSSNFFHFIRISSTDQFSFENVEFFGDYKIEKISMPEDDDPKINENLELDEKDVISKFPLIPLKSPNKVQKSGFFHNEKVNFKGFVKISSSVLSKNSSPILSIFKSNSPDNAVVFEKKVPAFIEIDFLTTSFQLTHFFIETQSSCKIEVTANGKTVFNGNLPGEVDDDDDNDQISVKNIISLHLTNPSDHFLFKFHSHKTITIGFFEIFGNLMQNNRSPDHLISLGLNRIQLSFKNDDKNRFTKNFSLMPNRLKFDFFRSGILSSIAKNNGGTINDNCIVSAYERYPEIERSIVHAKKSSPSEFAFGNSPQVTFDFSSSSVKLSHYALESEMQHWVVEGSNDGGESWFIIDERLKKKEDEERPKTSSPRFSRMQHKKKETQNSTATTMTDVVSSFVDKNLFSIKGEVRNRFVSLIRITNMDSFFDGYYNKALFYQKKTGSNSSRYSCGVGRIEFYGDIDVKLPNLKEKKNDDEICNESFVDDEINENLEDDDNCKPMKNLIFFPPFSVPNLQLDEETQTTKKSHLSSDSDYDYYYNYEYEYEEILEEPESSGDESYSYGSSDNNTDDIMNFLDFSNFSISELLRMVRFDHHRATSDDSLDFDLD